MRICPISGSTVQYSYQCQVCQFYTHCWPPSVAGGGLLTQSIGGLGSGLAGQRLEGLRGMGEKEMQAYQYHPADAALNHLYHRELHKAMADEIKKPKPPPNPYPCYGKEKPDRWNKNRKTFKKPKNKKPGLTERIWKWIQKNLGRGF